MKISNDLFSFLDDYSIFCSTITIVLPKSVEKRNKQYRKNEQRENIYKDTKLVLKKNNAQIF
jgi:hypothetical protein